MLPSLPKADDAKATLLSWSIFDSANDEWVKLPSADEATTPSPSIALEGDTETADPSNDELTLVTWNIDAFGYEHTARLNGILSTTRRVGSQAHSEETGPDVIFLQEVSGISKRTLAADAWVRDHYIISGLDWMLTDVNQQFYNATLLSRRRFLSATNATNSTKMLGAVWQVWYPSRYNRYALCCDVRVASSSSSSSLTTWSTLRLVNVHLDSLPIRPSKRPRQLEIVAAMLRGEGVAGGLVAGDFNPVLPEEDDGLVAANGLVDCWTTLRGAGADGFTWGIDGKERFPPARLDKVAVLGLTPKTIEVVHPGTVRIEIERHSSDEEDEEKEESDEEDYKIPWSDHSGLVVTFGLE